MQDPEARDYAFQERMIDKQQASDPNSVYADSLREEKIKNVIAQLNPELLLTEIEHRIRGEKKNHFTEQWEPINTENPISEELVQNYISFLNVYLTQNNSLSNFSPNEINNIMKVVIEFLRDDLSDNSVRYGLTKQKTIKVSQTKYKLQKVELNGLSYYKEIPFTENIEISIGEEVTDYNAMNRIAHIVCQSTFSVLKQAQNGMLANRIFKALRVTENLNEGGKKFVDNFKFW